jgi:glycosyltransferase involved in cell wall biosynthesis
VIRAIQRLCDSGCDGVALFAGDGYESHRLHLESMVARYQLTDRIRFLGHVDPRPVFWASDVAILPSDLEGCPIVIPEAMACGLVPVRSDTEGSLDQIEHGKDGFIFARGDHEALAGHLEWLARHDQARRVIAVAARETAQSRFSADTMLAKTESVYHEVLVDRVRVGKSAAPLEAPVLSASTQSNG